MYNIPQSAFLFTSPVLNLPRTLSLEPSSLTLGTRGSALALAQTALALDALRAAWPDGRFAIREVTTTGDKRQDLSLTHLAPGGHGYQAAATVDGSAAVSSPPLVGRVDPGLFTKELEAELLAGTISVAVHSLKDLPTVMPPGLILAATLPRADTADVLVFKPPYTALAALPAGAVIATSSLRRQRQLLWLRPGLRVAEVRGNVGTRLQKLLGHPDWAGLILARAGLERLGFDDARFTLEALPPDRMLPAVGQGAIGLQARAGDAGTLRLLAAVNHAPTWAAVTAERALLSLLGGGCQMPLGVSTAIARGRMHLRAVLFSAGGAGEPRFAEATGHPDDPQTVAAAVARGLSA